ncbi:proton-translocating NADH-quinone oxidoreductase, chain N family protein [Lysobacter enzymogenes]|uniref:NADH-quinone oxidoreductase subunit N n=1 Tax=Lysobacter enzymogenes TaxID=69 RepID=A0A0S2DGA7_LYSEN|nr:NADH-quinone oxidoreductase subunit NuoN [Lysobacter enzymogenes]ALN57522.1 proton-translocating NADH-quinone oxidoreductase, chain N family protein [Lysobacter enzymogenes]QCW26114.1 NADH-quinone oxidoreductase subunit NuoN [Lysobacter enzymogenes]UZW58763.1 NADH-quinone oxidoreductase subunit NuoN [Lysobacter enzymogenes]
MNMPVRSLADIMPLLPELVVVVGAFALLMLDLFVEERNRIVSHVFSILVVAAATAMIAFDVGGQGTVLSGMFVRDTAADVLKLGIGVVGILSLIYTWPYLRARGLYKGEVGVLMLFAIAGMMFLVSAGSLTMVYVGLEMLALCSYALVAVDRDSPLASEAAIKYFVLGALASGLLLYGLSLIYGATGSLMLDQIAVAASVGPKSMLLITGVVFVVAGIAFKFGAAPFHMWLPDVYQGAPTPITLFIGAAPKLAAFGMTYRLLEVGAHGLDHHWRLLLAGLAVLSLAIGNLSALLQTNLKRLLAYSTVSHVGFLFIGMAGGGAQGFAAAMFYAISYAIMTSAAFAAIIVMSSRGFEADRIDDYKGLNARNPWLAGMILCVMASLAGLPPFLGFWAKLAVLKAALQGDMLWLAIVGVVFAVIGAFYYLRVIKAMYFDEPEGKLPPPNEDRPLRVVFGVNALALLALGIAWNPIMEWCQRAFAA